jgi:hypothetical protein
MREEEMATSFPAWITQIKTLLIDFTDDPNFSKNGK